MGRKHWSDEKIFSRILNNKTDHTFWDNVRELRSRPNVYVFERSAQLTRSNDIEEILTGVQILAQLGSPLRPFLKKTLNIYFQLIRSTKDPKVLSSIFFGIGHNNSNLSNAQIETLSKFKDSTNRQVKEGLVLALSGIDHPSAINALIQLSNDKASWVRNWATFAIGSQIERDSDSIKSALWCNTKDKSKNVREEAIKGLAARKDPAIKEILKNEISDLDNYSSLLLESIVDFGDKEFITLLQEKLKEKGIADKINPEWIENTIKKLIALP
jgi:HEAT repeat protein